MSVNWIYAYGVVDVNVPYRLLRSEVLAPIVEKIPRDSFAPNMIISGMLALAKARILNHPVPCDRRKTGSTSLSSWRLLQGATKSFVQLAALRFRSPAKR
jgi:dolichol-phosphate mannosyltransferase